MSKKYARFISALFCGCLALVAAANALTPDRAWSELENRPLALCPTPAVKDIRSGKFMSDYEAYVTDQFVARDAWIAAKAYAERAVGKKENNSVYFCGDALITRFDAPDEKRLTGNIGYVDAFAQKAGVSVYFGLIPTQANIWADRLPAGAPNYDQQLVIDRAQQGAGSTRFVSLAPTLQAHKDEAIFYRTDHHWTSLGAYYGYTALAQAMGIEPIPLDSYTKTTVSTEFYGTVFSSSGVRWVEPDSMDTYVPEEGISVVSHSVDAKGNPIQEQRELYVERYLDVKDKYSMFLGGQQPLGVVTTGNAVGPKLLIVRDSYSDSLVPFLTPHFSQIHLIDLRYYPSSAAQYIQDNGIDMALVLYSVPNFASDSNLVWLRR